MVAGSITFSTELDNADLEKQLSDLKKKITKLDIDLAVKSSEKSALEKRLEGAREELDKLLASGKVAGDTISFGEGVEGAAERAGELRARISETESEIEKLNKSIEDGKINLEAQKKVYGEIYQKVEDLRTETVSKDKAAGSAYSKLEEKISSVLDKLQEQRAVSEEANSALLDVADTQTNLTGLAEEFSMSAKIGLVGIAKAAVQAAGSISKGVQGAFEVAFKFAKSAIAKLPSIINGVFSNAAKLVGSFGKKLVDVVKNMNVFSKLSSSLSQKFKQLGQMIKRVFVFSVITSGLRAIREQMSGYLTVNTQFSTALRQLQGVFLTAFQPIYDVVLPALTALINGISQAVAAVSQFTARLFGTTAKQSQKSAEALYNEAKALKETGSAAEEATGSLAGFDEINSIQTEKKGGGGAAAETGPLFDYEYEDQPFDSWGEAFSGFLDKLLGGIPKLKQNLLDFADWLNGFTKKLYDMFTFPGVLEKVKQLGKDLANALNDMVSRINWYQLGQALGAGLNLALQFLVNFIYTFDWINLGQSLAAMVNGAVSEIDWYAVGMLLWAGFKIAIETLAGFMLGLDMVALADAASQLAIGFFDSMTETIEKIDWEQIGVQVAIFLANVDWAAVAESCFTAIGAAFGAATLFLWGLIKDAWTEVVKWWRDTAFEDGKFTIQGLLDGIVEVVKNIGSWLKEHVVDPFVNGFKRLFGIHSPSTVMAELGRYIMEGLLNGITGKFDDIKRSLAQLWKDVQRWFKTNISKFFTADYWKGLGAGILDGLLGGLKGAWDSIKTWVTDKVKWITDKFSFASRSASSVFGSTSSGGFGGAYSIAVQSLPSIAPASIPALAQGAVIPPNREFVAVLGDQRNGTNLEAPEGLIRDLFREELSSGNAELVQLLQSILSAVKAGHTIMVGETVLGRTTIKAINSANTAAGKQLLLI